MSSLAVLNETVLAEATSSPSLDAVPQLSHQQEFETHGAVVETAGEAQIVSIASFNEPLCISIDRLSGVSRYTRKRMPIVIEFDVDDDCYSASFEEANITMTGETASEAIALLREHITDLYDLFKMEKALGPEPARQLSLLEEYIGEGWKEPDL